jgi:hypothetical protein
MGLQLGHILASEAVRVREPKRDAFIDDGTSRVMKITKSCHARSWQVGFTDFFQRRTSP